VFWERQAEVLFDGAGDLEHAVEVKMLEGALISLQIAFATRR